MANRKDHMRDAKALLTTEERTLLAEPAGSGRDGEPAPDVQWLFGEVLRLRARIEKLEEPKP